MNARTKVMVGYDGSAHAESAIDHLGSAGVTRDAEVLIAWVVKPQWMIPAVSELDLLSLASQRAEATLARGSMHRQKVIQHAANLVARAAERVGSRFPSWTVSTELLHGDPAEELLGLADEWRPDLVVVGSQGRSAIGRFFLGSVSKRIAGEAKSSVRVVRSQINRSLDEAPKLVAGARSLDDAERVINTIGRRVWPGGTKLRLVAVDDGVVPGRVSAMYPYAVEIFTQATEPLAALGIQVSVEVTSGEPETILLQAADSLETDSIFITANSAVTRSGRLDETAQALVTNATTTVEIVRWN
ncbi:MAG TPA: universal stress protein [Pyrinomonadaceae bacterium]|nr:universal stress protein [Pyrinomonadaceae bacterium]